MSDAIQPPGQNQPNVLAYSSAPSRPSGWQILLRAFLFLMGIAGGIVGTLLLGLFLFGHSGYDYRHSAGPQATWPAIIFFAILVAAFASCVLVFRRFRRPAKWLLMGLFIAAGFASLAEGFCFLNQ